jgi:uncharacterized membrane protein YfcA
MTAAIAIGCGIVAFGFATGMLSGILGIGGGTFMVPFMVLLLGISQHSAEATSLFVVLPTAIVATITLVRRGAVDLRRSLTLGMVGAAGGIGGALLALALPADDLRRIFGLFMLCVGLRLLHGLWTTRATAKVARVGRAG